MKRNILVLCVALLTFGFIRTDVPMGLNIGDSAPDFKGINQSGKETVLSELLETGPTVILFYRGEWCPYCNRQLKNLQDSLSMFNAKGANVIAISPEKTENIVKTIAKTNATFNIVADQNLKIMKAYKVSFDLDEKTTERYKGYGIDLLERNGTNGNNLPVPAVYIVNKAGKITYRYFDVNYKSRPSAAELLKNL